MEVPKEVEETLKITTNPIEVINLSEKFKPMLTYEALMAFNAKSESTVFEYMKSSNGTMYRISDVISNFKVELREDHSPILSPSDCRLEEAVQNLIFKIDPGVKREAVLCRYGSILAQAKLKDVDKISDEVVLQELATVYNKLIDEKLIYPCVFSSPFKMELSLYDYENDCAVLKKPDGSYIGYNGIVRTVGGNADEVWEEKTSYPDNGEKLPLTMKRTILYTAEEAQELTAGFIYCLFVFPFRNDKENLLDTDKRLNELLGKELFAEEGQKSKWIINF